MRSVLAVFLGGCVGTALRLLGDDLIVHHDDQFPVSTLLINTLGSFALGFLVARVWPSAAPWLRGGLGPGLLGGFTTFSAVMVSLVTLTVADRPLLAVAYLVLTLVLGLSGAAAGLLLGRPHGRSRTRGPSAPPIDEVTE